MELHCLRCMLLSHTRRFSSAVDSVPRITMPHSVVNRIDRMKAKASAKRHQRQRFYKGPLIISCKRKEFNHYKGQTYSDFSPQQLAAGGWKHRKSVGDYFTVNAFDANPAIKTEDHIDFPSLGLNNSLINGLEETGIKTPTNIQALTIPHMMEGKNVMCAAETGSGKTFAFLLPILHKIQMYKKQFGWAREMNSPYAVILTPARELSDQIHNVAMSLAPYTKCVSDVICGGRGTQTMIRNPPNLTSDIIVSTPGVFSKLLTNRIFSTERMMHIVLDEADTLFDDSFSELSLRIISKLKITSEKLEGTQGDSDVVGMQIAMVGATMPRNLDSILGDVVPSDTIETVTTTSLHRLMPHVPQKFMRLNTEGKKEELLKFLKGKGKVPSLVFCNKSSTGTANYVGHFLSDNGISNEVFHSNMPQKVRDGRYDRLQDGSTNVLVATDIASRGLDTLRVQHVVNYDFPHFMSDYIHRVGRVGRVGSHGASFVLSFVTHQWDVDLLWRIEAAARQMTELQNVNANIKRKLTGVIGSKYHLNTEAKNEVVL